MRQTVRAAGDPEAAHTDCAQGVAVHIVMNATINSLKSRTYDNGRELEALQELLAPADVVGFFRAGPGGTTHYVILAST